LPRKRFVKSPVLEKGKEYLGSDHSYAKTVEHQGMPIMYDDRTPAQDDCTPAQDDCTPAEDDCRPAQGRQPQGLAPSTVWRWLSWLGGMPRTLRAAWDLIRQKDPNSPLHRQPWAVSSTKYRSEKRRETLVAAMQLLAVDRVCEKLFGAGLFPRYAISQGWS